MVEEQVKMLDSMEEELKRMQEYLEIEASDEPNELIERLGTINVYLARTGKMLADAKYIQDCATNEAFDEMKNQLLKTPPTIVAKLLGALTPKANYIANWCERINRTCVHAGDNIRTQVSFAKETMRLENSPYGNR